MSDQDNLRDRIADVIAGEEEHPHPRGYTAHAQAIIDEFELQVIEVDRIDLINHSVASYQIVGKWVEQ